MSLPFSPVDAAIIALLGVAVWNGYRSGFIATKQRGGASHGRVDWFGCPRLLQRQAQQTPGGAGEISGPDDTGDSSVAIVKLDDLRVPSKILSRSEHFDCLELRPQRGEQVCKDTPMGRLGKSA